MDNRNNLSIEPFVELKLENELEYASSWHAINRTIRGIETTLQKIFPVISYTINRTIRGIETYKSMQPD